MTQPGLGTACWVTWLLATQGTRSMEFFERKGCLSAPVPCLWMMSAASSLIALRRCDYGEPLKTEEERECSDAL